MGCRLCAALGSTSFAVALSGNNSFSRSPMPATAATRRLTESQVWQFPAHIAPRHPPIHRAEQTVNHVRSLVKLIQLLGRRNVQLPALVVKALAHLRHARFRIG